MANHLTHKQADFVRYSLDALILELDFAMWLFVQYDCRPETTPVSLIREPQAALAKAAKDYLADPKNEWVRFRCTKCGAVYWQDPVPELDDTVIARVPLFIRGGVCRQKPVPEYCTEHIAGQTCGAPLKKERLFPRRDEPSGHLRRTKDKRWLQCFKQESERSLRRQAESGALGADPVLRVRCCGSAWVVAEMFPGNDHPSEAAPPLREVLTQLTRMVQTRVDKLVFELGERANLVPLAERRTLIPEGRTLQAKHADYLKMRDRLIRGYQAMLGAGKDDPEYAASGYSLIEPAKFPPPIGLPDSRAASFPPLRGKIKKAAEYIDKRPGSTGEVVARNAGYAQPDSFRRAFRKTLEPRGYQNRNPGYYPPEDPL